MRTGTVKDGVQVKNRIEQRLHQAERQTYITHQYNQSHHQPHMTLSTCCDMLTEQLLGNNTSTNMIMGDILYATCE
jgi:hypothetical protein